MAGLWVIRIKPSQEGLRGNGGEMGGRDGKMGSPPEKVWWPPVLLIFYLIWP